MLHPSWDACHWPKSRNLKEKKNSVSIVLEMALTKQRKWVINDQSSQELCANAKPFFCDSNMMNFNFIQKKMSLFLCTPRIDFLPCEVKKPIISRLSDFSCSCWRSIIAVWIKCFSFLSPFDHIVAHNRKCTNCLQLLITDCASSMQFLQFLVNHQVFRFVGFATPRLWVLCLWK